jgi:hypothetical protein
MYWRLLKGDFRARNIKQFILRLIGLERGYPAASRSSKWTGFSGEMFDEVFGIVPESPHEEPYGMEPLGYGGHVVPAGPQKPEFSGLKENEGDEVGPAETAPQATNVIAPEPVRHAEKDPGSEFEKLSQKADRAEIRYRLLEASGDAAFANAFADAIFSFYREKRKIVLAFDVYLGGGQGTKALDIFKLIKKLKSDNRYASFLENIEVIRIDPSRGEQGLRSLKENIDSGSLVFTFAKDTVQARESLDGIKNTPNVKLSYINEEDVAEFLVIDRVYYPIFEIVTIAIAKYIDELDVEDIREISEEIAVMASEEGRVMVFRILPSIRRFETNGEMMKFYAMKRDLLVAA